MESVGCWHTHKCDTLWLWTGILLEFSRLCKGGAQGSSFFPLHGAHLPPLPTVSSGPEWAQGRREERSLGPHVVVPPDSVSGLPSGGTGSERPRTEPAGPAPSARPATAAAAGTTCVTEVGNDFKTVSPRAAPPRPAEWQLPSVFPSSLLPPSTLHT